MARIFNRYRSRLAAMPQNRLRWWVTAVFLLLQVFIWGVIFRYLWYNDRSITDIPVYYNYASRIFQGMVPYRDFSSEYPPVAMLLFSLPRLFSGPAEASFVAWFQAEMMLFSCGIVLLISWVSWRQWGSAWKVAGTLGMYCLFLLSLGSIVQERFDLAAALIILASLACYVTDRHLAAWLLLGVGVMTKVVPILLVPVYLIHYYRRRQMKDMLLGPLVMLLAILIVAIPFLLADPSGLANAFLYHAERPLQIESTWASPILLFSVFLGYSADIMNSYGSHNVYSSASDTMVLLSAPLTGLLLLFGYWVYWRRTARARNGLPDLSMNTVIRFVAIAVLTFIVGGKVLSPQFLIWLLPLIPLVIGADRLLIAGWFELTLLVSQVEFPYGYWQLYSMKPWMVTLVAVRNGMLITLLILLFVSLGSRYRAPERVARQGADIGFLGSGRKFRPFDQEF